MKPRVLVTEPLDFSRQAINALQSVATVNLQATSRERLPQAFQEYDVVWIRLANRITAEMLGARPRCRILAVPTTGLDHIDQDACRSRNIQIVSLQGEAAFLNNVRATAELTLTLALSLIRRIPEAAESVVHGKWDRDRFRGRELYEKTVGIIGVGRLGTIVAGYFRALGCTVIGYDPRTDYPHHVAERVDDLRSLLARSDVVCLMAKYEPATRHLMAEAEFAACKPGSVFINTSRGGIVQESAMLASLESGRLAGAALDVLDGEPDIDADHPVVKYAAEHANLLIVPHIGGNTFESFEKTELFLAEKVVALLQRS